MCAWANGGYGGRVHLLMLCVETGDWGLRTAKAFGKQFRVPSAVLNAYIDKPSELPKYGQLGCGGFTLPALPLTDGKAVAAIAKSLYTDGSSVVIRGMASASGAE